MKRFLSLFLICAMMIMPMSVFAFSDAETITEASTAIQVLSDLNIVDGYEDGTFRPNDNITRAEMTKLICRVLGYGELSSKETPYSDVSINHWASGYINIAHGLTIVNGHGDDTFAPEDTVTYEQAVKMVVCALGYKVKAQEQGTYPANYLFVAQELGLLDGIKGKVGENGTRAMVCQLIYNALDIPLMQKIVSGADVYGVFDGVEFDPKKTIMSEYLNIVKITGILSANSISSSSLRYDQVQIDIQDNYDTRFAIVNDNYDEASLLTCYIGNTNAKDLLGKKVDAYVTYEARKTEDCIILSIANSVKEDKEFTIEAEDIKEVVGNQIAYYTNKNTGKTKKIDIKPTAVYYVNGENVTDDYADFAELSKELGEYAIIDFSLIGQTSGSYDYDYVFANVYENFVVDSVDKIGEKVYAGIDSISDLTYIDYNEDADYELVLNNENGLTIAPTSLNEYDIVTMQVNPFDWVSMSEIKAINAVLVKKSVKGTITEINELDNEYYINGEIYELAPGAVINLTLDDAGTFYLDINNKIVAFDQTSSKSSNYGVIVKSAATAGVDNSYEVKMFTSKGELEIRTFADKVKVPTYDGSTSTVTKTDEEVAAMLTDFPVICSYKLNSVGDISTISFADTTYKSTAAAVKSAALVMNGAEAAGEIEAEGKEIKRVKADGTYYLDDDTVIIAFNGDIANTKSDDFELYSSNDFNTDQAFGKISVYDVDANNYASLVYIEDADITLSSDAIGIAMVKNVTDINNADGDSTHRITGINVAGNTSVIVDDETAVNLAMGDVYYIKSSNVVGEAKNIIQITDYDADNKYFALTSDFKTEYQKMIDRNSDSTFYFGKVNYKQKNTIYFANQLDEKAGFGVEVEESVVIPNNVPVMVYDASKTGSYKVSYETAGYMNYATKANDDGSYNISNDDIKSYYILVREYNGKIVDVVYYCYTTDIIITNSEIEEEIPVVEPAGVVVDAIINDEFVIAE